MSVAAIALASCSSDTVVEQNPSKPISAEALKIYPEMGNITRGNVWDNTNFTEFKLTTSGNFQTNATTVNAAGGAPLVGVTVQKAGGVWSIMTGETPTDYYWPSKTASSDFTAWAPVDEGSYTASTTISEQKDIVVAFNSGSATEFETGVPLKFRHILSQIVIKADNASKNKVQIKVKDVRLNNIKQTGKWSLPTASTVSALGYTPWSDVTSEVHYLTGVGTTTPITLDGSAKDLTGADPLLLIPQQLEEANIAEGNKQYISVLVQIVDATDNTKLIYPRSDNTEAHGENAAYAWTAVDVNTLWEPGKKYIYTLHFKENSYGKIDGKTDGGNPDPGNDDDPATEDPEPGDDITDAPVKLVLDVEVIDWVDVNESKDM